MAKQERKTRWQRLLRAHRLHGPWMTSWQQIMAIGTVTPSKVRHEATLAGWKWQTRRAPNGRTEYRPVRQAS